MVMDLDMVSRAYVLDDDNNVLLVKHHSDSPWVMPGGHVEHNENPSRALRREIKEELGVGIEILGMRNATNDTAVMMLPLPVSMQEVEYYDQEKEMLVRKCEFWYFVKVESKDFKINGEIVNHQRFSISEILRMRVPDDTFAAIKDVLEQNEDLLELL
jgi:8-oxo-dGTP pyrophosphatase MutT (NUDIX family)